MQFRIIKILQAIGLVLLAVGTSCANSENLLIPAALTAVGVLIIKATTEGASDE